MDQSPYPRPGKQAVAAPMFADRCVALLFLTLTVVPAILDAWRFWPLAPENTVALVVVTLIVVPVGVAVFRARRWGFFAVLAYATVSFGTWIYYRSRIPVRMSALHVAEVVVMIFLAAYCVLRFIGVVREDPDPVER